MERVREYLPYNLNEKQMENKPYKYYRLKEDFAITNGQYIPKGTIKAKISWEEFGVSDDKLEEI